MGAQHFTPFSPASHTVTAWKRWHVLKYRQCHTGLGTLPKKKTAVSLKNSWATCISNAWNWEVYIGKGTSCTCHSLAVSWLGCHLQAKSAGAEHLLWAWSWRTLGLHPSLQMGGWTADNSYCLQQWTVSGVCLQTSLLTTTPPAPHRKLIFKVPTYLKACHLFSLTAPLIETSPYYLSLDYHKSISTPSLYSLNFHHMHPQQFWYYQIFWSERHQALPLQYAGQRGSPAALFSCIMETKCCTH